MKGKCGVGVIKRRKEEKNRKIRIELLLREKRRMRELDEARIEGDRWRLKLHA